MGIESAAASIRTIVPVIDHFLSLAGLAAPPAWTQLASSAEPAAVAAMTSAGDPGPAWSGQSASAASAPARALRANLGTIDQQCEAVAALQDELRLQRRVYLVFSLVLLGAGAATAVADAVSGNS